MPGEIWIWGIALAVLAVIVAAFNDLTKKSSEGRATFKEAIQSIWNFLLFLPVLLLIFSLLFVARIFLGPDWFQPNFTNSFLLATLGFVVYLFFCKYGLFKALLWTAWYFIMALIKTGKLPGKVVTAPDGKSLIHCPGCAGFVTLIPGSKGDTAYICERCGKSDVWASNSQ